MAVLIGADYLRRFMEDERRRGGVDAPVAVRTKLGWVLQDHSKVRFSNLLSNGNVDAISLQEKNALLELHDKIHTLWDLDSVGVRPTNDVHRHIIDNIEFTGERYSTKLPWKEGHEPFQAIKVLV